MNNTLTGLGLALVLALAAALIGPWFVNWSAYREEFAAQAGVLIGAPVKLTGAVDARLLPSPYVRFRGLVAGEGPTRLSVDEVEIELAVAPLLRGEYKAERVKLVRPRIGVAVGQDGSVRTALSGGARTKTRPPSVSFDKAEIVDGAVVATTPAGPYAIDRITGVAEAGSLAGPFRFEGAAGPAGGRIAARFSTGRADAAGAMRVKLAVTRDGQPETFEADGALTGGAKPSFDGRFALERPATRRGGAGGETQAEEPWRIAADVKGHAARLRFENLDLVYGPDDRAVRLAGRGETTLGAPRRFNLALDARQVDLDRFVGDGRPKTPGGVLMAFLGRFAGASRPPFDGRVRLDLRGLVLGGDVVQDLSADLETTQDGWHVRTASASLPAGAKVSASGALAFAGGDPGFAGKVDFATADLPGLRRWISGGDEPSTAIVRRFAVKGDVTARSGAVSIEEAEVATDGTRSTGRVAWRGPSRESGRARIDATLVSDRLDLDALGVDRLLSQALGDRTSDIQLALEAKALTYSGVRMTGVSVDGALGSQGVDLKRLVIQDAGGAALSGAGRITAGAAGPEGELGFKVEAERLAPLIGLARAAGAPAPLLDALDLRGGALAPIKLAVTVGADAGGRRLAASGDAAGGRLDALLSTKAFSTDAPAEIDVRLVSADGRRLAALVGLELSPFAEAKGGEIAVKLSGAPGKGMTGEGRFAAIGVDLGVRGVLAVAPAAGLSGQGEAALKSGDLTAFAEAIGRLTPGVVALAPASLAARVAVSAEGTRIDDLRGDVAGRPVRGRLSLPASAAEPIEGEISLDDFPAAAFAALAVSPDALSESRDRRSVWPSTPFGASPLRGVLARLEIKAVKVPLGGGRTAEDARFVLALRRNAVAIETFEGALDGGRLTGSAVVTRSNDDASVSLALRLEGVRAERLLGLTREASPLLGGIDANLEAQGTGRTLSDVVGALTGAGSATLTDGAVRRLDVAAIDRVESLVERGMDLDAPSVAEALARDIGGAHLQLPRANAPFTLTGGVLRVGAVSAETPAARLGGGATFDLRRLTVDADLTLQPNRPDAPQIGVSFEGPASGPKRSIDATALTGWLSVRAVERETKRIEAMEADIRERARIARQRAEEDRKRAEEDKRRADEERRKAEADRRKRDAEARALIDTLPRPAPQEPPDLPPALDLTPPGATVSPSRTLSPATGVFGPTQSQQPRTNERRRLAPSDTLTVPQSILPPAGIGPADR